VSKIVIGNSLYLLHAYASYVCDHAASLIISTNCADLGLHAVVYLYMYTFGLEESMGAVMTVRASNEFN